MFKCVGHMSVEVCGCVSDVGGCLDVGMDLVCNGVCMSEGTCISINMFLCVSVLCESVHICV